ncbi:MAG: DUF503 domain-containing protein [Tissierellia bacterium]|nr:DUF503 domain-containing protein [Tissierellia bacterium]
MIIGACELKLLIYGSNSLKDKRQVIKSILGRIKSRFNVSIAEVDLNGSWQTAIIGFSCVSNNTKHSHQILTNVIKFIEEDSRVEIIEKKIEIL